MTISYKQILEDLKDSPIPLEDTPPSQVSSGLKMKNHFHPWSITEKEFNVITQTIIDRDCKRGFEVATAFGISALAAGLGFRQTNGKLITLDAYIEEQYNNCGAYTDKQQIYDLADGFRSVNYIIDKYELRDNIEPVVGWSPDDLHLFLEGIKLDYAFIDGGHWESQIIKDTTEIAKYLNDKFVVFFHDGQGIEGNLKSKIEGLLQTNLVQVCGMPDCWNLLGAYKG